MIERSSREYYFHPVQPSKIYWLQPGHQKVGDQVFGAFMGANEGPDAQLTTDLSYIKSTKSPKYNDKKSQLFLTVSLTVFGFVVQFVGLRGLHPSIIMAQMGATLIMSIVRTCLRTKRIDLRENQLSAKDLDLTHHNRQELDCFAFHLENIGSFELLSPASELLESQYNFSDTALVAQPTKAAPRNTNIIRTRTRLAELTSGADKPQNMIWDDLPIREIARNLARAIEATMDLLSTWTNKPDRVFEFKLAFRCEILGSALHILDYHVIRMDRSDDTLQWRINDNELEAILGLWTWSLLNTTPNWTHRPLFRLIGLDETEAASEETDLYFQKWIFRQTEARMVSSSMIHSPHRLFGYSSDNDLLDTKEILVVKTQNRVEVMATQDLYIRFLDTVFGNLDQLGGTTDIHPGSQGSFLVRNTRVDELVHCFESFNLGSREDALLCIVPVLKRQGVLPELAADSPCIRSRVEELVSAGNWNEAYDVLRWLCERCEGDEFERSIFELGFLCRKALLHDNPGVRNTGVGVVCQLLQKNIRAEYFRGLRYPRKNSWMHSTAQDGWWSLFTSQLRWMVWQICKDDPKMESIKYILVSRGQGMLGETLHFDNNETDVARYTNILVQWLALPDDLSFALEISESDNQSCFLWALGYGHVALANWLLIRWAEVCQHWQVLGRLAFGWAAASPSESAIETLCRHGCDINGVDKPPKGGHTALLQAVGDGDEGAVRKLLGNGADADAGRPSDNLTPLMLACQQGRCQIARLLVTYGADVDSRDWSGTTALPWAARNGYLDIVYLLLSNGADICSSGCNGMTALHYAASNNHSSLVDLLLTRGADVNAVDEKGSSPLILASRANLVDTIRLLLSRGANTHTKDQSGMGALEWARECQHQEAVFLLDKAQISTSR